jgi:molybdate/tungstate transport system substrate-binding protein
MARNSTAPGAVPEEEIVLTHSNADVSRRELLIRGGWLGLGAAVAGFSTSATAQEMAVLEVAYAGSMGSLMDGPVKRSAAQTLKLDIYGRAQGANALAQLIVGGSISPDVFISVTAGPMLTVLRAGKASMAQPIARTEMVIAYSPKSRFAPKLDAAAKNNGNWWQVLEEPGFRFGRSDPSADPQGRNIMFTMMLAAKLYHQPELVEKVLGSMINPQQINMEASTQARLQSGELDAASAYKIQPGPLNLPYISLPKEINLSGENVHADHPDVSLTIGGKTYFPEPLIYYAAVLRDAHNSKGAAAFLEWVKSSEAQVIFRQYQYDPAGDASALHA